MSIQERKRRFDSALEHLFHWRHTGSDRCGSCQEHERRVTNAALDLAVEVLFEITDNHRQPYELRDELQALRPSPEGLRRKEGEA